MQKSLIVEEFKEFLEAEGMLFRNNAGFHEEALKELSDLVYVCYQYAANMEWDLDEALSRVHISNMSKLDEDGKPTYREEGKLLKSKIGYTESIGTLELRKAIVKHYLDR